MSRTIPRYGWKPSLPDPRDIVADVSLLPIYPEVDPRADMPPVYDQGQLGSCTANAVAAAIEYDARLNGAVAFTPSRLDIYYGERSLEGTVATDSGAYGRDGFKFAHKTGTIPEADWPYHVADFAKAPPADADHRSRIGTYAAVPRLLHSMQRVLSNDQTIAFGFSVFESFESAEVARTGIMPFPKLTEKMLGGHEILMIGYLRAHPGYVLCRNSWSKRWGLDGYCLVPWQVILDRSMSSDFRTIRRPAA